jgi:hypothetical protein
MKWIHLLTVVGLLSAFSGCERAANSPGDRGTSDRGANSPEQLVEHYIAAINAKDSAAQEAIIHPRCFKGTDADQNAYLRETLARDFRYTFPPESTTRIAPLEGPDLPFYTMVDWPVMPTHSMEITFTDAQGKATSVIRFIAADQGRWYWIVPRLNAENLSRYSEQRAARTP